MQLHGEPNAIVWGTDGYITDVTWIFSFLKLPKKTDRKFRTRYSDLVKEWSDIEIGNENGVVDQPDRIRSLHKNGW